MIARLLAEEFTLLEAAAWFRSFNNNPPDAPLKPRGSWAGGGEAERLCRQVISWARGRFEESSAEDQAARLEQELKARLAAGPVELPFRARLTPAGEA